MVDSGDDPPTKAKPHALTPEEIWVREFLGFYGTENAFRFCIEDLNGVSVTRAYEALTCGECVSAEKCDGPGTVCIFEHKSDDNEVQVAVNFVASEPWLEVLWAMAVENGG